MLEKYIDVIEASKILETHAETVKHLIREGKIAVIEISNTWIMERDRLRAFVNTYDGNRGRVRSLL